MPKKRSSFFRFSVCAFLEVSTNEVWFFNFLTNFTVPILDSICFSITKGDREVIGFSGCFDLIIRYLAKFSFEVKIA